jgi:8-oxo-dGTP pyrophosphatase MutT (NUDIX family)
MAKSGTSDPKTWPVRRAVSAGGVVIRTGEQGPEVVMVRPRGRQDVWGLPKGTLEPDESAAQTAVREVREETGIEAEIVQPLEAITYWFVWAPDRARIKKTVHFFLMRMLSGDIADHDDEIDEVVFVPLDKAPKKASYSSERKVLRRAAEAVAGW